MRPAPRAGGRLDSGTRGGTLIDPPHPGRSGGSRRTAKRTDRRGVRDGAEERKGEPMTCVASPPTDVWAPMHDDPVTRKRLLVVDDHPAVRAGLRELLADEADFEVVAAVDSAEDGIDVAKRE